MFNLLHITHCGNLKFYIVFCCCWKRIDSLMTVIDLPLTSDDKVTVIYLFIVSFGWSVWPVICYLKVKVCVLINQSFWISSAWSFCCASAIRIALSFFLLLLFPITRLLLSNLCGVFSLKISSTYSAWPIDFRSLDLKAFMMSGCSSQWLLTCFLVYSLNKPVRQIMPLISPRFRDDSQLSSDERSLAAAFLCGIALLWY